jgi:hypothetical protein
MASTLPPAELFPLSALVTPAAQGIASRVLARTRSPLEASPNAQAFP